MMGQWNVWSRRAAWGLLSVLLLLVCAVAGGYHWLWKRYEQALAQLEPRIQRFQGLVDASAVINAKATESVQMVQPWVQPRTVNAQNEALQKIRQVLDASGATVVASQAQLEMGDGSRLPVAKISATLTATWPGAVGVLEGLQRQVPPVWTRSFSLMREGAGGANDPQLVRMVIQVDVPLSKEAVK